MEYDKPHLELPQQIEKLASKGLQILERDRAARFLGTVGFYRVSAYAYPFRELLGDGESQETSVQFRSKGLDREETAKKVLGHRSFDCTHYYRMISNDMVREELTERYQLGK